MIHELKIEPKHFTDVVGGRKPFEVRLNDRNYAAGDYLALNEYIPDRGYTGRCTLEHVTTVLKDEKYCKPNHVIMGLAHCCVLSAAEPWLSFGKHWRENRRGQVLNDKENSLWEEP